MSRHGGYRRADVDQKLSQIRDELQPRREWSAGRYYPTYLGPDGHRYRIEGERDWRQLTTRVLKTEASHDPSR